MSDVYDESGTLIATTHPIQAAQHDVNTNNAPERIEALIEDCRKDVNNGLWYGAFSANSKVEAELADQITKLQELVVCLADQRPVPSESDEAVAREIAACVAGPMDGLPGSWAEVPAILARHRAPAGMSKSTGKIDTSGECVDYVKECQPAAVSADAVEWSSINTAPKDGTRIWVWGRYVMIEGVTENDFSNSYVASWDYDKWLIQWGGDLGDVPVQVADATHWMPYTPPFRPKAPSALSPETVCGGE